MRSLSFYFRNWLLFSANIFLCPFCLSFQVQLFKHLSSPAPEILLLISNNIGVSRVKSSVTPTVAMTMGSVLHVLLSTCHDVSYVSHSNLHPHGYFKVELSPSLLQMMWLKLTMIK